MKQFIQALLFLCILSIKVQAQSSSDTGFAGQKFRIDSLVTLTDSNKKLTQNMFVGSLMWGSFNANISWLVGTPGFNKAEYFFKEGNAGKKIFYYNKNELIKIIDNGVEYYYAKSLFDKNGKPIKDYLAKDILFFSQQSYQMMLAMIQ
jgi:hypothetical protein